MAPIENYQNLKQRKQALLLESELNRALLRLEVENLRNSTARLDSTMATARRVGPWLLPLLSVVGLFAKRRVKQPRKESSRIDWIKLGLRYLPLLLSLRKTKSSPE